MTHHFLAGEGLLWVQPNGPGTEPFYLGCHQLGDVDQPEGDVELVYCRDLSGPNRFKVVNSIQGTPGAATTTVTASLTDAFDYLERIKCPFTLFAHMSEGGRVDNFANFDRSFIFRNARVTNRGLTNLVARQPEDQGRADQTFDISAEAVVRVMEAEGARQSVADVNAANDITFCNSAQCRTESQVASESCQEGYAVFDAGTGVTANVYQTLNGGTWAATATDPFAVDEHIIAIECFEVGRGDVRLVVARGSTDAGNPAEIAYSDDGGATWTLVDVGADDGEFAPTRHSLFALDSTAMWLGTDSGRIYFSADGGLSWTTQEDAALQTAAWNSIHFVNAQDGWAVGAANEIARTIDGGTTWSAITGPSAQAAVAANVVFALDRNRAWIGYADGDLYKTLDGGVNWTAVSHSGSGVGQIRDIAMFDENIGYMVRNNASPVGAVLWTINGGYSWVANDTVPTNSGLNAIFICDEWTAFVAGEANGGTGYIAKLSI